MTDALAGKRILLVEDEYFIASDLKRALQKAGAHVLGPVGVLDAGLALAEQPVDAAVLDPNAVRERRLRSLAEAAPAFNLSVPSGRRCRAVRGRAPAPGPWACS